MALLMSDFSLHALTEKQTARFFNGPTVVTIGSSDATLNLSQAVLASMTEEEKKGVYFEYFETNQVCIMIYPTPEYCLPKKTELGSTTVVIKNLKADTSYTAKYKRDSTIRCVTTPCPGNEFESLSVEFVTKKKDESISSATTTAYAFLRNLWIGSKGGDVSLLQEILRDAGYFKGDVTGYFGGITMSAVRAFQKEYNLPQTGYFGPLTRESVVKKHHPKNKNGDTFEGTVTAYSTACFADGECSITVDDKKVVTTIGWSQAVVGKVVGIPDFGSIENNIGAHAKVYAKKTDDGYTLYGNADYYIKIIPKKAKLQAVSVPVADAKNVQSSTWVWEKTVMADGSIIKPNKLGSFTLAFDADGNLSGKTDCNGFFGSYTFGSDGLITFGPFGSTLMFCDGSQEGIFTGSVSKMNRFLLDGKGNSLYLLSGNGEKMYFIKK